MEENETILTNARIIDDKGNEIKNITDISLENNSQLKCNTRYLLPAVYEYGDLELSIDEPYDIQSLIGIDMAKFPDKYSIEYVEVVQARKHRKKRINKKWAKRYGYKYIKKKTKGWELHTYTDGSFEFKKDAQEDI